MYSLCTQETSITDGSASPDYKLYKANRLANHQHIWLLLTKRPTSDKFSLFCQSNTITMHEVFKCTRPSIQFPLCAHMHDDWVAPTLACLCTLHPRLCAEGTTQSQSTRQTKLCSHLHPLITYAEIASISIIYYILIGIDAAQRLLPNL